MAMSGVEPYWREEILRRKYRAEDPAEQFEATRRGKA
jgi:hypothetical protein